MYILELKATDNINLVRCGLLLALVDLVEVTPPALPAHLLVDRGEGLLAPRDHRAGLKHGNKVYKIE